MAVDADFDFVLRLSVVALTHQIASCSVAIALSECDAA